MYRIARLTLTCFLPALLFACSSKPPEDSSLKDRLTWYGERFGSDPKLEVYTDENRTPAEYSLHISTRRRPDLLLITDYFKQIMYFLENTSEDEILKTMKGDYKFALRTTIENAAGFTKEATVLYVNVPNNLQVNWDRMYGEAFMNFLKLERRQNTRVKVTWIIGDIKPDDWY